MIKFLLKNNYWQDKKIFLAFIFSLLINAFFWFVVWYLTLSFENTIPLHYNIYFGVDILGDKKEIFKLPLIALLILIINFVLSFILYKQKKILSYFLILAGFLIQVFLLTAGLLIISL